METPLVSINIPVYKCEKYILRCLESVKNQTYTPIEIILVNDCTPDNSIEIIKNFANNNPTLSIRLIHHQQNQGLSVVRNTGIDESIGDYVFFLDSDDDITTDCIELLIKKARETNASIILGQNKWINTFDNSIKENGFPTRAKQDYYKGNKNIFKSYANNLFPITSWNKLIERKFIKNNKLYFITGLFAQDELWFFHLMLKVESLAIVRNITYNYYLHDESVIFNRTKRNFENHQTIIEYFTKSYHESDTYYKKYILRKIIGFKDLTMIMQWKSMRDDIPYWKKNYSRLKKAPSLSILDYMNRFFSKDEKKKNFLQNLPTDIGFIVFRQRYGN